MSEDVERAAVAQAWAALLDGVPPGARPEPADLEIDGGGGQLPSAFAVHDVAVACVAVAVLAAAALPGRTRRSVRLDRAHVADAVRSERYFRHGDRDGGMTFASLSRFWPTADGWVRTHANYPWHRQALLSAMGAGEDTLGAALAERSGADIEDAVVAAGGVAGAVRTITQWRDHPQGRAVAAEPLIGHRAIGDAAARPAGADLRVLDLTRVIAGPVCTRLLGALGADVLRLDPPDRPDLRPGSYADTLLGKRSAALDLSSTGGSARLHELLERADVVVCGYRPGSLDRFGLDADSLAERHPGIVAVFLDAWGHTGPWAGRRGFDSVVQAPTGIAAGEADGDGDGANGEPGALPCQLLDHGTGYLAAAAALDGVRRQRLAGGTHARFVSLARTAAWLTSMPATRDEAERTGDDDGAAAPWVVQLPVDDGTIAAVAPPGVLDGASLAWPLPVSASCADPPVWLHA